MHQLETERIHHRWVHPLAGGLIPRQLIVYLLARSRDAARSAFHRPRYLRGVGRWQRARVQHVRQSRPPGKAHARAISPGWGRNSGDDRRHSLVQETRPTRLQKGSSGIIAKSGLFCRNALGHAEDEEMDESDLSRSGKSVSGSLPPEKLQGFALS